MIQHVILTGDFLATRQSEQASNLRWVADLIQAPIEAAGLRCSLGLALDRDAMLARAGLSEARDARHCWIDPESFDEAALEALRAAVGPGGLVVGYEMLSGTRAVLDRAGIAWVDLWLHPVRFCDDIFMSCASNRADIHGRIRGFGVEPEAMAAQARLLKIQNYRGFNRPQTSLRDNACLLVGQTPMDKSVLGPRGFASLGQFENEINRLSRDHGVCYFAPHPKARRVEPAINAMLADGRLAEVTAPTYLLLSDPAIAHVAGLSSSVIEEARYFGKETTFFVEPPVAWADPERSVAVLQDFAFAHFWAEILQDVAEVIAHPKAGYIAPKNKLRDALSFDWGYPHINRDRFEAGAPGEAEEATGFAQDLDAASVVCFDVFDTLIRRRLADPRDLFSRINEDDANFAQLRMDAAAKAGETAKAQGRDEPGLSEIYQHLEGFDPADEFARELEVAVPRAAGRALFEAARASGKRIVLASDMYLSGAQIEALLRACGYEGWQAIYVSSEIGAAKRTGRLWAHILEQEALTGDALLHVGDNALGDVAKAQEYGIRTHHLPMARTHFAASGAWAKAAGKTLGGSGSELLATVQHDLADAGRVAWDAERFGAAVLGPLLVGFAQWLSREASARGLTRLHFLTREGDVMARVCEAVWRGPEAVEHGPLFASRALVAPLGIESGQDIAAVIDGGMAEQTLAAFFERQFGVSGDAVGRWDLSSSGFATAQTLIGPKTDRAALGALAKAHEAEILAACAGVRTRVQGYLAQSLGDGSALVDIGYNGTVQRAYGKAAGKALSGLYMGLFESADDLVEAGQAAGWLVQGARKADHGHGICKHRAIWEVLLCAPEGSVVGLEADYSARRAVARDLRRQEFVREAHDGAVVFATRWAEAGNVPISAEHGQAMLNAVLDAPDAGLARLLGDLEFEDPFERSGLRPLIGADAGRSLWKARFAVASSQAGGFRSSGSGAQRPAWKPWGAYGVLGWRHVLPVFVGPVIGAIGEPHDVDHYKEDPIGFFRGLSDQKFRKIGRVLYPWDD